MGIDSIEKIQLEKLKELLSNTIIYRHIWPDYSYQLDFSSLYRIFSQITPNLYLAGEYGFIIILFYLLFN